VWYPALPDAEPLPFPCSISNPYWEQDQYEFGPDNCDFDSIEATGKPRTKPGSGRGHFCGTEQDFQEGGLYLPDDPPELFGMQGLPACCNPAVVGQGGVVDGGKASVAATVACGVYSVLTLGETHTFPGPSPPAAGFLWAFPVTAGLTYRITLSSPTGQDWVASLAQGACPNGTHIGNFFIGDFIGTNPFINDYLIATGPWFFVVGQVFSGGSASLRLDLL